MADSARHESEVLTETEHGAKQRQIWGHTLSEFLLSVTYIHHVRGRKGLLHSHDWQADTHSPVSFCFSALRSPLSSVALLCTLYMKRGKRNSQNRVKTVTLWVKWIEFIKTMWGSLKLDKTRPWGWQSTLPDTLSPIDIKRHQWHCQQAVGWICLLSRMSDGKYVRVGCRDVCR